MSAIIITPALTDEQQELLEQFFSEGDNRVETKDAYWLHGADGGEDYCYACAKKRVAELRAERNDPEIFVDGGCGSESDSTPFCAICQCRLDCSLTRYGASEEVAHFTENGFNPESDDDRASMYAVIASTGWLPWPLRIYSRDYERQRDEEFYSDLHRLGFRILESLPKEATSCSE